MLRAALLARRPAPPNVEPGPLTWLGRLLCSLCRLPVSTAAPAHATQPSHPATSAPEPVRTQVSFTGEGGTRLHGEVISPPGGGERHPAMVLVGGSGPGPRAYTRPEAEAFARAGVVTLIYDKRTDGYSLTERSHTQLAEDALAALRLLRSRGDVDRGRTGLWGFSEGAWVAPIAAARSRQVTFLVLAGASGVTPARQTAWAAGNILRHHGARGHLATAVPGKSVRFLSGAGLFPEADFDPAPYLARVRQPVLAVWGEHDVASPPRESMAVLGRSLARAGNPHLTMRVLSGADHALRRVSDGYFAFISPGTSAPLAAGYARTVSSWIDGLAAEPPAPHSDTPPRQQRAVPPEGGGSAWALIPAHPGYGLALSAVFASWYVWAVVARIRCRRRPPEAERLNGAWPPLLAHLLAATGLLTVVGTSLYAAALIVMMSPGPVVGGVAVLWAVLRLSGAVAVLSALATAVAWFRRRAVTARPDGVRLGLLLGGGVLLVPWLVYWQVLAAA
ncbi:alpha/beta hydrolase family protein [Actinopolyspora saharensis]|uniref:alpha/beta hydrolase family protein n=1 Tax=Actinopolyspora saharensis TaxID=995062 RepID=UPI003F6664DB